MESVGWRSYLQNVGIEKRQSTQYVHLKDAKVFNDSSTTPSDEGTLWRGKLSSISGFSLGMLGQIPKKLPASFSQPLCKALESKYRGRCTRHG